MIGAISSINAYCRPAGAATALAIDFVRSDSFPFVSVDGGSDNSGAAYSFRAFYSAGRLAIAIAIAFGLHQPVWAVVRP